MNKKLYLIAGESSGDFLGSVIMQALKKSAEHEKKFTFLGVGGRFMQEQGLVTLFPVSEINLMGFFEIVPHIVRIKKLIEQTALDVIA